MSLTGRINRVFKVSVCILAALLLISCSDGKNSDVSMYDLHSAMMSSSQRFRDMEYVSSEDKDAKKLFKNVSDMDYSKVDKFFISYASNGSKNADEIVVIQLKSKKDVNEAKTSLNEHLENRKSLYATYMPSQSPKLMKGKLLVYNNIVCLVVADDMKNVENAFYDFLQK